MAMKTVNVATLKQKLSAYLRQVEEGDEIVVTSHRRHIARVIPERESGVLVRRPIRPLSGLADVRGVTPAPGFFAVETLANDRRTR